jgi:hypothetical protein
MNRRIALKLAVSFSVQIGFGGIAAAACLDRSDPMLTRYFHPGLEEETERSVAIVVGQVVQTRTLQEDTSDPEGWTAFIYTIEITQVLKGKLPARFCLKIRNDSGGYRMQDGESHLLFLTEGQNGLSVDPCGNSREMSNAQDAIDRVRAILAADAHAD